MLVLIPSYQPDSRLVELVRDLRVAAPDADVLVVDDGSGPAYAPVFDDARAAGAEVIGYARNRGKGAALKRGFAHVAGFKPGADVVTADGDGQHTPADILRVAQRIAPRTIVLGGRRFTGRVPLRSRFGNTLTRTLFRAVSGQTVHDTQTGLRGLPGDLLGWASSVAGDRFEYEFNQLLAARDAGVTLAEVPIDTIYLDENASSHFRPIQDSARIYAPMLAFAARSTSRRVGSLVRGVRAARRRERTS